MRPVIGLTCSLIENKRAAINLTYLNAVRGSGALPVTLPYVQSEDEAAEYLKHLDGFLFTGGADIDPAEYGELKDEHCGEICKPRDESEKHFFNALVSHPLPTLGICRGLQTINVFAGGTLWQDIPSQVGTEVKHSDSIHEIELVPGTLFSKIIGAPGITVNSYHHQGVKRPAEGLIPCAFSPDGVAEALCMEGRDDFLAVQYHPEMIYQTDENAKKIFAWFVDICKKGGQAHA